MVSITHTWSKQTDTSGLLRRWTRRLVVVVALGAPVAALAGNAFVIRHADMVLRKNVYLLNADIDYRFTDEAVSAMKNGVPLIIGMEIRVVRDRSWWLDKDIATLEQAYLLIYHALTEKYIIHNLNSGIQKNYASLDNALQALGKVENLPLIDANLLEPGAKYTIELRTGLDIEALPAPMRPLAYISSDWQLQSDWYSWSLVR
jgi:hypothetical protein